MNNFAEKLKGIKIPCHCIGLGAQSNNSYDFRFIDTLRSEACNVLKRDEGMGGTFSIGARFHGNVVALHAGLPAFFDAIDSRVRDLCEYFHLPHGDLGPNTDLYEIYQRCDYSEFNRSIDGKYLKFQKFMRDRGLPCHEDLKVYSKRVR